MPGLDERPGVLDDLSQAEWAEPGCAVIKGQGEVKGVFEGQDKVKGFGKVADLGIVKGLGKVNYLGAVQGQGKVQGLVKGGKGSIVLSLGQHSGLSHHSLLRD